MARTVLTDSFRQLVALLVVALPLGPFASMGHLPDGWSEPPAVSWWQRVVWLALVVALGHGVVLAVRGRLSWPLSALGMLLAWAGSVHLLVLLRHGEQSWFWTAVVTSSFAPTALLSLWLRTLVPVLRPDPVLRPAAARSSVLER